MFLLTGESLFWWTHDDPVIQLNNHTEIISLTTTKEIFALQEIISLLKLKRLLR